MLQLVEELLIQTWFKGYLLKCIRSGSFIKFSKLWQTWNAHWFLPQSNQENPTFHLAAGVGVHWVPDLLCTGGGSRTICIETGTHAAETTSLNMSPVACGEKWGNIYLLFVFLCMLSWAISSVQDGISDVFWESIYIYTHSILSLK